jgi:hypothetical protein
VGVVPSVSVGAVAPSVFVGFSPLPSLWGFSPPSFPWVSFPCGVSVPLLSLFLSSPSPWAVALCLCPPHSTSSSVKIAEKVDSGPDCEVACDCRGNIRHSSLSPLNFFPPSSHSTQRIQLPFESHPHSFTLQHHPVTATASQQRLSLPTLRFFWLPPPSHRLLFLTQ